MEMGMRTHVAETTQYAFFSHFFKLYLVIERYHIFWGEIGKGKEENI
jgi:hypothetical protein